MEIFLLLIILKKILQCFLNLFVRFFKKNYDSSWLYINEFYSLWGLIRNKLVNFRISKNKLVKFRKFFVFGSFQKKSFSFWLVIYKWL